MRGGGGNAIFIENVMTAELPSIAVDAAPGFVRTVSRSPAEQFRSDVISRAYVNLLGAAHNAVRL